MNERQTEKTTRIGQSHNQIRTKIRNLSMRSAAKKFPDNNSIQLLLDIHIIFN